MMKTIVNIKKDSWIDWIQLSLIGLAAPFFLFPSTKYIWVLLIVPVVWICRWIVKKEFFIHSILDWAIVVLLIQVFATCIIVPDLAFSLPKIVGFLFGVFFFYSTVALLDSEKLIKWGIAGFLGAGLTLSIFSILGMAWGSAATEKFSKKFIIKIAKNFPEIKWNLPGAEAGFNANAIGGILILIIPLSFVLYFSFLKREKEYHMIAYKAFPLILSFVITFVLCIVLFLTQSIGSWIGLIIGIWILLLSWKWKKWSLLVIFLLAVFVILLKPDKTLLSYKMIKNEIIKPKIELRKPQWLVGINTVNKRSFFGIGMNRIRLNPSVGYGYSHAHNHLLHTAAELGIPGLIAYLAILIGAGYMCFQIWRKSNIGWMRMTAMGLGCGQLAHFIFGMADSIPLGAKVGIFFWFSLALIAAMYNYTIKEIINKGKR